MSRTYLTPDGFKRLRGELLALLNDERPKLVQVVTAAAAQGDRSENADYIYGKRRLREIDRRIRFLQQKLVDVEVVEPEKVDTSKVSFGVWVHLEDENGERHWYQIVGEDEIDPLLGRITFSSPLGKSLLGKKMGAVITVRRPKGELEMEIIAITNQRDT